MIDSDIRVDEKDNQAKRGRPPLSKIKTTPSGWRPGGKLPLLKCKPGFTAKWADAGKVTKLMSEGWIVMRKEDNVGSPVINYEADVNDGNSLSGEIRYRGMIAMKMPDDVKQARDEWHRSENKEAMQGILKETDQEFANMNVETYAPNKRNRITIE